MRYFFHLTLIVALICTGTAVATESEQILRTQSEFPATPALYSFNLDELDEDTLVFFDDFEGEILWESVDYNSPGAMWHTSAANAYEDGVSWWCADEEIPGYDNGWLQYLETPAIDLSATSDDVTLSLMLRHGSETGVPTNPDYDGWDGSSIFVSTDEGETWTVLANPSYAYTNTSIYAFGGTHGLGPGIAGWTGVSDGWVACEYSLADINEFTDVRFRFAFASDAGVNSGANEDWIGFLVDDITVADGETVLLENDAEGTAIPSDLIPVEQIGGESFVLQEDEYSSETHAWQCANGYDLFTVLISPEIELPAGFRLFITYAVFCDWPDSDGDGDNTLEDYYQIEVSNDGGSIGKWPVTTTVMKAAKRAG